MPGIPFELDCGDPIDIYNCTLKWVQEPPSEHQPTRPSVRSKWEVASLKSRWQLEDEKHEALLREWEQPERATVQRDDVAVEPTRLNGDLYWGHVEAHPCKTPHGTREYTAVLMNLPTEWGGFHGMSVEACEITPLEIQGAKVMPMSCDDRGNGVVIGLWEIDRFEPDYET